MTKTFKKTILAMKSVDFCREVVENGYNKFRSVKSNGDWFVQVKDAEGIDESLFVNLPAGAELPTNQWQMMDATTAGMVVSVYNALNDENKASLARKPLQLIVQIGWKLTK